MYAFAGKRCRQSGRGGSRDGGLWTQGGMAMNGEKDGMWKEEKRGTKAIVQKTHI
jgi:hypothetical protein